MKQEENQQTEASFSDIFTKEQIEGLKKSTEEVIEVYDTDDSPIKVRGNKEKGYAATLGKHRLTEWKESPQMAIDYIWNNPFQMMMTIAGTIIIDAAANGIDAHEIKSEDIPQHELRNIEK